MSMKFDGRLMWIGLPLAAIVAIAVIQSRIGDLAPAPLSVPDRTTPVAQPMPREPEPTILAPSANPDDLPPGTFPTTSDAPLPLTYESRMPYFSKEEPAFRPAVNPGG